MESAASGWRLKSPRAASKVVTARTAINMGTTRLLGDPSMSCAAGRRCAGSNCWLLGLWRSGTGCGNGGSDCVEDGLASMRAPISATVRRCSGSRTRQPRTISEKGAGRSTATFVSVNG